MDWLAGSRLHLVEADQHLARRDAEWMRPLYEFLGLTVGVIFAGQTGEEKRYAYQCDITYGTNNEFGFDYLRDNMSVEMVQRVQRERNYAIVDEVDNILIDEARTPLIISGPSEQSPSEYHRCARLVPGLRADTDYAIDEKHRTVALSDDGITKLEKMLHLDNLYDPANFSLVHFVENALRASVIFQRDREYVVKDGEVVIVDEFTGRLMFGRRYSDGLHQAIEAKEGVNIQRESVTYATITLQNYFRMYDKLAGMTGTAATEAEEFWKIYKLEVVEVPTNMPMIRTDQIDLVYKNQKTRNNAVVKEIEERHQTGQPVLVGTTDIDKSEALSEMLKRHGIPHEVLNAKQHEREAVIVAQAGRPGAVTVSTSMAGRGTDIVLEPGLDQQILGACRRLIEDVVSERHRHRYEFNPRYRQRFEAAGLHCSGESPDGRLVEFIELEDHPFWIATQAHPEFKSRPLAAHHPPARRPPASPPARPPARLAAALRSAPPARPPAGAARRARRRPPRRRPHARTRNGSSPDPPARQRSGGTGADRCHRPRTL